MRLGILEAGRPPAPLDETHGRYPAMFADLLRPHLPAEIDIVSYAVIDGEFPESSVDCDAWLITGSAFGVYDPDPWIATLKDFARGVADAGRPMVGICFGHQLISEVMGGRAIKSDKGWGVGSHRYALKKRPEWLTDEGVAEFDTYVSHQDQVTEPPPGAEVLAGSDFCPNAMLAIGDRILTLQSHPEMPSAYVEDLYTVRRERIGAERIDAAMQTIVDTPRATDADRVAAWIGAFLTHALNR
ncbi:MAG: type 1 glutamine amidotransferase [Alphaproteobacteria bacterium]|jgi:GMP synthase-like glutamine amidotransferase|nr:type 1 glutamine amidotransferase [Alphaproteobacteria bacterium]MBO6862484.1 type 1 glutamine amidotransferase [Alphaproteobacteria bacterium]MEC9266974.1 type 1 glutamine amidotransferase [Pseudomonadota bacterium]